MPATADPKREVPDYDGRGNIDADGDSWVMWIPRVVLSPLYLANEYLLRRPIGFLVRHEEAGHWADTVQNFFTFGPNGNNIIVPTALFDFGLLPSVGLYYAGDDAFVEHNQVRLHGATWGSRWINLTGADRYAIDRDDLVEVRAEFKRSEDNVFFGLGPDVTSSTQSRYGLQRYEGSGSYRHRLGGLGNESRFDIAAGMRHVSFVEGDCCGNPSIDTRIAEGDLMAPPGYGEAYTTAFAHGAVMLDSRGARPSPGSGVYLELHGNASMDTKTHDSWLVYGGVIGGAVDLTGHQRTIKMQLAVDMIDPLSGDRDQIPFVELPSLTSAFMPGFITGWMMGQSTAAAQIGYTWPVWLWLDGQTRFSVGNAFGDHLAGLSAQNLRFSYDIGFTTISARDQGFEVLFGLGTETIGQGAGITSVRVTFGSRKGF